MGLKDDRKLFFAIRKTCRVIVSGHAVNDYPERGFSVMEITRLVRYGKGAFTSNPSDQAIPGSYLFFPEDQLQNRCKLVVLLKEVTIEEKGIKMQQTIVVCSAYRE